MCIECILSCFPGGVAVGGVGVGGVGVGGVAVAPTETVVCEYNV